MNCKPGCALRLTLAVLALAGCGPDDIGTPPPQPSSRRIVVAHGDRQEVMATSIVQEPLMARVVDAQGQGVPNVEVRWTADSSARLLTHPDRHALTDPVMRTDRYGFVAVYVQATRLGPIKVVAMAAVENSIAEFEVIGITPNNRTIAFGPIWNCGDPSAFYGSPPGNVEVFVGATVTFVLEETAYGGISCTGRVASVEVPDGGQPFASDTLVTGSRFRFTPNVPGTWVVRDVINGGETRMTAKIP